MIGRISAGAARVIFDAIAARIVLHSFVARWAHVAAIIEVESAWRMSVVSSDGRGSIGLMQVLPEVAAEYGGLPQHTPEGSIETGCLLWSSMCRQIDHVYLPLHDGGVLHEPAYVQAYNVGVRGFTVLGRRNELYYARWKRARDTYERPT